MFCYGQLFLGSQHFLMTCYFVKVYFCTPVNNFSDVLFKGLLIDRLGALSCELPLLKVQRRVDALSDVI